MEGCWELAIITSLPLRPLSKHLLSEKHTSQGPDHFPGGSRPQRTLSISVPCFLLANNLFRNTVCNVLVGTFYKYLEKCVQDFTILLQPVREAYLYFCIYVSSVVVALFVLLWELILWHGKLLRKCLALWNCPLRKGGLTAVCSSQMATVRDLGLPRIAISTIVKAKGLCSFFPDPPNSASTGPGTTLKTTWGVPIIDQHTHTLIRPHSIPQFRAHFLNFTGFLSVKSEPKFSSVEKVETLGFSFFLQVDLPFSCYEKG